MENNVNNADWIRESNHQEEMGINPAYQVSFPDNEEEKGETFRDPAQKPNTGDWGDEGEWDENENEKDNEENLGNDNSGGAGSTGSESTNS